MTGSEVKSAKAGQIQLGDAYASLNKGEIWLHKAHISPYLQANRQNHEPMTVRKLLLHRAEIDKLVGKTREKGQTLIPTKVYLKGGRIKVEIALAKGKQDHDKRETIKNLELDREARQAMTRRN